MSGIDRLTEGSFEFGRDTSREGREDGIRFSVRKFGVTKNRDELLDRSHHDSLVIVTGEDVAKNVFEVREALVRLVTDDAG